MLDMPNAKAITKPKIHELAEIASDPELPILDEKKHAFLVGVLQGRPAIEAYSNAGYNLTGLSQPSIYARALNLRNSKPVKAWINAARATDIGQGFFTRDQHLAALEEIKQIALQQGVPGAAVQCEVNRGKVMGFYEETLRVKSDDGDIPALIGQLRDQLGPDVANAFAAKLLGKPAQEDNADG